MEMLPLTPATIIDPIDWVQIIAIAGVIVGFWPVMRAVRKDKDSDVVFRTVVTEKLRVLDKQHGHDHPVQGNQSESNTAWLPWVLVAVVFLAACVRNKE